MSGMPERPREHVLETESRRKFESLLPNEWVVRQVVEDYGIDLEVEIFEGGFATGLTFRVQMKSTDKSPRRGRISRSGIKTTTLNYWRSLDVPVLVVVFSSPVQQFYGRWAHGYDKYYQRKPDQETLTFGFDSSRLIGDSTIATWPGQVRFIKAVRQRQLSCPIPLSLESFESIHGHSYAKVRVELERAVANSSGIVSLVGSAEDSVLARLDEESIFLILPTELASITWHIDRGRYVGTEGLRMLVSDIMLAAAWILIRIGALHDAAKLVRAISRTSAIIKGPAGETFCEAFLEEGILYGAFNSVIHLIDAESEIERGIAEAFLMAEFIYDGPHGLSGRESEELLELLTRRAEVERLAGHHTSSARTLYNIGERWRSRRNWDVARDFLDRALATDASYGNRGYYWRTRGAVSYELGEHEAAANDYRRAIDSGGSPEAPLLLADILMRLGRYEDSKAVPLRVGAEDYYALGERMHSLVIASIVYFTGVTQQVRKPVPEDVMNALSEGCCTVEEIKTALRDFDALDPQLWIMLSKSFSEDEITELYLATVVCADLVRVDGMLWAFAACFAVGLERHEQEIDDLCDSGIKWADREFFDAIEELSGDNPGKPITDLARDRVYARAQAERPRWNRHMRITERDGTYHVLEIPSP